MTANSKLMTYEEFIRDCWEADHPPTLAQAEHIRQFLANENILSLRGRGFGKSTLRKAFVNYYVKKEGAQIL